MFGALHGKPWMHVISNATSAGHDSGSSRKLLPCNAGNMELEALQIAKSKNPILLTCKAPHLPTQSHSIVALPFWCSLSILRMLSRKARVASGSKAMRAVVCAKCGSKVSRGKGSAAPSPATCVSRRSFQQGWW